MTTTWQVVTVFFHSVRTKCFEDLDEAVYHATKRRTWHNVLSVQIIRRTDRHAAKHVR